MARQREAFTGREATLAQPQSGWSCHQFLIIMMMIAITIIIIIMMMMMIAITMHNNHNRRSIRSSAGRMEAACRKPPGRGRKLGMVISRVHKWNGNLGCFEQGTHRKLGILME